MRRARIFALILLALGFAEGLFLILAKERGGHPLIEDEFAYLFQAQTLASGHLSFPSPPLPEFFEAAHLLVVPRFAAKYLPGHALLLAPFEAARAPWLCTSLELGLFAMLLFFCARAAKLSTGASLFAGLLPLVTAPVAELFATYLSWTSSLPLTAAGLLCALLAWRHKNPRTLAIGSALAGLLFWVRPYTGIALWAALGAVALLRLRKHISINNYINIDRRRWLLALAVPVFCSAIATALVCKDVTGSFTELPWSLYARQYAPFDGPGFGPTNSPPPLRESPPHLRAMFETERTLRDRYTVSRALAGIPSRLREVASYEPTGCLWPLALIAAMVSWETMFPVLIFALIFFLLQLTFYAPTPFYLSELSIPLALALAAAADKLARAIRSIGAERLRAAALIAAALPILFLATSAFTDLRALALRVTSRQWPLARYQAPLAPAASARGLVFIRYADPPDPNLDLDYNPPDLKNAQLIRARDLGLRNRELMARFPERPAFLFEPETLALTPIAPSDSPR